MCRLDCRHLGWLPIACLLSLSIFLTRAHSCIAEGKSRLPVGVVVPLTGDLAWFGVAFQRGIELAISEGVAPRLSFFFEDDRSVDRAATINALNKLIASQRIKVAVMSGAPTLTIVDPIVKQRGVLALSAIDSNNEIAKLSDNSFGYGWSNELTGEQMGMFACHELKATTAAIVSAHDEWSELIAKSFAQAFTKCGGKIVLQESIQLDDTDLRSLTLKIAHQNPQVVYFPLYRGSLLAFARQIKQAAYKGILLSAEGVTDVEVKQLGSAAEGMFITAAYLENSEFERRYKTFFGLKTLDYNLAHVGIGYEAAKFLNACVVTLEEKGLATTTENLRAIVSSVELDDVLGKTSFQGGKIIGRAQTILQVRGSALRRYGE